MSIQLLRKCIVSDEADQMSAGILFQSQGPAVANDRSPTVARRDGRTSSNISY